MDVWFIRSPIETMVEFHSNRTNDILISSHQSSPMTINIGVYSVLANERTKEFFELCILMARESPNTHDQVRHSFGCVHVILGTHATFVEVDL